MGIRPTLAISTLSIQAVVVIYLYSYEKMSRYYVHERYKAYLIKSMLFVAYIKACLFCLRQTDLSYHRRGIQSVCIC